MNRVLNIVVVTALAVVLGGGLLQANVVNNPGFDSGYPIIDGTFDGPDPLAGWELGPNTAYPGNAHSWLDTTTFAGTPHENVILANHNPYGGFILTSDLFAIDRVGPMSLGVEINAPGTRRIRYDGFKVEYYDAGGSLISSRQGNVDFTGGTAGQWRYFPLFTTNQAAVPGATHAKMIVHGYGFGWNNNDDHYLDNIKLLTSEWTTDWRRFIGASPDALSGDKVLAPATYASYGPTNSGARSTHLVVQPNTTYDITYSYKFVDDPSAGATMRLIYSFYDAGGNLISQTTRTIDASGAGMDWNQFPVETVTSPAGAAYADVWVRSGPNSASGADMIFDNVIMNAAPTAAFTATYNMDTLMFDLDASTSWDPDWRWDDGSAYQFRSDRLTYRWLIDGTTWLDGMLTSVYLPKGDHTIQLFVSDAADNFGTGFTDSAQVGAYSDVPEPATMGLLVLAGGGLVRYLRRRRNT